jgi:two-component system nitrogen regulation response regulator GlnG
LRRGRFEQAEGGTLFLDEIGDMPAELQTRLLRVLSDGHYYRVGGQQPIKANVRVIAATHQNLEERVKQGLFREDLFHRLNVIRLRLPALCERLEDIPVLAKHFLAVSARELGAETKRLSTDALAVLSAFAFPGNVRQLENICRWVTVMAPAQLVEVHDLPVEVRQAATTVSIDRQTLAEPQSATAFSCAKSVPLSVTSLELSSTAATKASADLSSEQWPTLLQAAAESALSKGQVNLMDNMATVFETVMIQAALKASHGKRIEAAQRLGIGRNTIARKIQDLHIDVQDLD